MKKELSDELRIILINFMDADFEMTRFLFNANKLKTLFGQEEKYEQQHLMNSFIINMRSIKQEMKSAINKLDEFIIKNKDNNDTATA